MAEASVTASQIATNAPASVPRRARSVCSEMRSMSGPQSGQALCDLLGGRAVQLAGQPPVGHEHDAVRPRRRGGIVGDHDQRAAALVDRLAQERQHGAPGARVERAGRLVGEHHARFADEGASDGDALLLAARELGRPVAAALVEADALEDVADDRPGQPLAREPCRQRDVLLGGQRAEQVEGLKDEADPFAAQAGERSLVETVELELAEAHAALRRPIQARGELQQRRLPGARRPHDRRERSARHRQRDAVERAHLPVAASEDANDVVEVHHRRAVGWFGGAGRYGEAAHGEAPSVGSVQPAS